MRMSEDEYNTGACPVSMYFYGERHNYESATILPHAELTKMPLKGSTKVSLPYNGTLSESVTQLPWSQALMDDARFFAEAAGRRAALAKASINLYEINYNSDSPWGRTVLSRNPVYQDEYRKLATIYNRDMRYGWAESQSLKRYSNYADGFIRSIQGGTYSLTTPDWISEMIMISRFQLGTKILWDAFDHTYDMAGQKSGRKESSQQQLTRTAAALITRLDREIGKNTLIQREFAELSAMSDSLQQIAQQLERYVQLVKVVPLPSQSAPQPNCQASSRALRDFYKGAASTGSGTVNTSFTTLIPASLQSCSNVDASSYDYLPTDVTYDQLVAAYRTTGKRFVDLATKLADSSYNPLSWQRFDRLVSVIASAEDAFDVTTTSQIQISRMTLGGLPDGEIRGPITLMERIVDYMHEWYATHKDFDVDDIKTEIPQDPSVIINARDLWGTDGRAERCVAEMFMLLTGGMETPKIDLDDVLDDSDIAEHLSVYFNVNEDLLEDYLDTLQKTKTLREFGISSIIGRLPEMRSTTVRIDLFEPQERTENAYYRAPHEQTKNMRLTALLPDNVKRVIAHATIDVTDASKGLEFLRKYATECSTAAKQVAAIESSSVCSTTLQRTNVPAITSTNICTTIKEHSVSRGYSPMWKTSSDVLKYDVLSAIRGNHGRFIADDNEPDFLSYDPVGREWVVLVKIGGWSDEEPCKSVGPYVGTGMSFGSGTSTISSVRIGVVLLDD